jgi:hypothetical protein
MDKSTARSIVKLIHAFRKVDTGGYNVKPKRLKGGQLTGFHQWADERPCEGAFLIESVRHPSLWVVVLDWKMTSNFYLALFPESRSGPLAEIQKCVGEEGEKTLRWTYSPTKRDGKNPQRRAYFEDAFRSTDVCISVPANVNEVGDFLDELFSLAISREKADALDSSRPATRQGFPEGKLKERLHRSRERNSELIRRAKQIALNRDGALRCACCNFDFEKVYGKLGKDFIEGHHTKPVSSLHVDGELTLVEDIALVCANCHRMLHRRRPWLGMAQLSMLLK